MKKCTYCGKEYPDSATICETDQQPLREVRPPVMVPPPTAAPSPQLTPEARRIVDDEHIKLLSIFHYIVAGLALAGLLFLCLHFMLMTAVFFNSQMWRSNKGYSGPPPQVFEVIMTCVYLVAGGFLVAGGILNFLSAKFLRQRIHRTFSLVTAGLNCLQFPLGTALGVFTITVLSRPSVRERYDS
jgi:hypothetical protein